MGGYFNTKRGGNTADFAVANHEIFDDDLFQVQIVLHVADVFHVGLVQMPIRLGSWGMDGGTF